MYALVSSSGIYTNLYYFYLSLYIVIDRFYTFEMFLKFNLFFLASEEEWRVTRPPSLLPKLTESLRFCFFCG